MLKENTIEIVGSHGLVGEILHKLLQENKPFAYQIKRHQKNKALNLNQGDFLFIAAGENISQQITPIAIKQKATVIDLSSHFRHDPKVPLVIPEINGSLLDKKPQLIASPNCTATLILLALAPLYKNLPVNKVQAVSFQAASGAGREALKELEENLPPQFFPHPYKNNLFIHESTMHPSGYVDEELKVIYESQKILDAQNLNISIRSIRVPIKRAHSIALSITFNESIHPIKIKSLLDKAPGIALCDFDLTPQFATNKHDVFVSNIRAQLTDPKTIDFWIVGDQLLKGAALNALQIFLKLHRNIN